ncbi:MAG: hypothetical protein KY460_02650 [Actinobacteria bacterium]|nr:hypothetical protein [Actinomycetota bacterium]
MDAAGELAQLRQRLLGVLVRPLHQPANGVGVVVQLLASGANQRLAALGPAVVDVMT